jgi:hypothetical protein
MDPLITNGMDGALLRVLEKRGDERDPVLRRKRPARSEKPVEEQEENNNQDEADLDAPKHTLDDLA